jgi:hypothetical protein
VRTGDDSRRRIAFTAVCALAAAAASLMPLGDPDLFYHLAHGRYILGHGIPSVNTFSFTWPQHPWRPTDWLFDVGAHLLHAAGGFTALGLVNALAMALAAAVSVDTLWRLAGRLPWICLPPMLLVIHLTRFRITSRPQLVTFLGLALLLNLWYRPRTRGNLALLALLGLLWANSHAGVVFGAVLALLLLGGSVLGHLLRPGEVGRVELRGAALAAGIFLASTLLNVNGLYPYRYTLEHLFIGRILPIEEFAPTGFAYHETYHLYALLLAISLARLPLRHLLPALAVAVPFWVVSLKAVRLIPKFGWATLPFVALAWALPRAGSRWRRALVPLLACLAAGALLFFGGRDLRLLPPGWGFAAERFPVAAADFVQGIGLAENTYNDFDDGGYLIHRFYPWKRVFQDGKVQRYPPDFFREVYAAMDPASWEGMLAKHRVDSALVKRRRGGAGIDYSPFFLPERWALVHLDGSSYLFLRRTPGHRDLIARHEYRVLRPRMGLEEMVAAAVAAPRDFAADAARLDPGRILARDELLGLANGLLRAGRADLAEGFVSQGERRHPGVAFFRYYRALLLERQGRRGEAADILRELAATAGEPELRRMAAARLAAGRSAP